MDIKFTINPFVLDDDLEAEYLADIQMEDGTSFTIKSDSNACMYYEFKSDVFEDLFRSLAEASGIDVTIEEEDLYEYEEDADYSFFLDDEYSEDLDDFNDELNGC